MKARRRASGRKSILEGDRGGPEGMRQMMARYLEHLSVTNHSPRTVEGRSQVLDSFALWCEERELLRVQEVTKPILERYQRHLFYYRKTNGKPLGVSTQAQRLTTVQGLFRWLTRANYLLSNPASELELPRLPERLPFVLTAQELDAVMGAPDLADPMGLRDRAILETAYATGLRRMELANLDVHDVDASREVVTVRMGKGQKDRLTPIGERALEWIGRYVNEGRPQLVVGKDSGALFLTINGRRLAPNNLTGAVRALLNAAGIRKPGSCHLFRHTAATQMLEGGADIRFIQAFLGHTNIASTQLYTSVSIRKLQEVYGATHPGAKANGGELGAAANGKKQKQANEERPLEPEITAEELLTRMADEESEELKENASEDDEEPEPR